MREMDYSFEIQVQHLFSTPLLHGQRQLLENHVNVIVVKPRLGGGSWGTSYEEDISHCQVALFINPS